MWHIYAICTMILWAYSNATNRFVKDQFSPMHLAALRFFIASAVMLIVVLIYRLSPPKRSDIPLFLISSVIGLVLRYVLASASVRFLPAGTSSAICTTTPVFTMLLSALLFKEKFTAGAYFAVLIELIGIVIIMLGVSGIYQNVYLGVGLAVTSAICMAIYNVLQKKHTTSYDPLRVTAYTIFISAIILTPYLPEAISRLSEAKPLALFSIILQGVGAAAAGNILWVRAMALADGPGKVSNYQFLNPVLSALFAYLLMREVPDRYSLLGGAVIIIGLLLFRYSVDHQLIQNRKGE